MPPDMPRESRTQNISLRDARGQSLNLDSPPRRVVSLVPSLTETLCDIGADDSIVGVTDFCIFPENRLAHLPRLGGTKNPDLSAIEALHPDLVYVNLEENLKRHAEVISRFAPVFASEPRRVDDVIALIHDLGSIHERSEAADVLVSSVRHELSGPSPTFTFVCPIWKNPWMWCGGDTYVSHLIEAVGGSNQLRDLKRYPTLSLEEISSRHPDVVILPDEPYVFEKRDAAELTAAGLDRVLGPFPGHLVTWHGSRTLLGLRFLRRQLASLFQHVE